MSDRHYSQLLSLVVTIAALKLPSFSGEPAAADAGMLLTHGASIPASCLKGAKPADLPVEQTMKSDLEINLKTAKALGLTIPPSILLRADRAIE